MNKNYEYNYHIYSRTFENLIPKTKSQKEIQGIGKKLEEVESQRHLINAPLLSFFTIDLVRKLNLLEAEHG